jgi:hypothetical protein
MLKKKRIKWDPSQNDILLLTTWNIKYYVCFCVWKAFLKKNYLFYSSLQINFFLIFSDYFDVLMSRIIFLKIKNILFWYIS